MNSAVQTRKTPVAIFGYNRPQYISLLLETLARCARLNECQIYIYCDAAKGSEQEAAVEESRRVVRAWAEKSNAVVIEREENYGLARSIVTAVTELCEKFGRVIVLEDDLQVSPDFIDYMLQALDRYADESQIYQISGYMFRVGHPAQPDAFFAPMTTSWGWATWDRAWRIFDWNATGAVEQLTDPQIRRRFNLDDSITYDVMLRQRLAGQNSSWAILWWWAVFRAGGLVLHPRKSLVWTGGFDDSGTHNRAATEVPQDALKLFAERRLPPSITLPEKVMSDEVAFNRIKDFRRKLQRPPRTIGALARRAVKKLMRAVKQH